jgi:hypothetical protein
VVAYCWGVNAANTVSSTASAFTITFSLMRVVAWIVASVLFKAGNSGRDLWGWSCGGADGLGTALQAVVNFGMICQTNVSLLPALRPCS